MFGNILHQPQLTISNYPKGGDFMGIEQRPAIQSAIEVMEWEGAPLPGVLNPTINPDQGRVINEMHPDSHPLVSGKRASVTDPILRGVEETAMVTGRVEKLGQPK